ncbi:MAG: cell wall metabolism sensor histidine kinase WalK [Pelosinus sp.]|nr:cell wall metabolism sensor histidine kinase WalK [Pelosinus sp.]
MKLKSIFSKLLLSHIIVFLVSTIALGLVLSYLVRNHIVETKRQELFQKGQAIISLIELPLNTKQLPNPSIMQVMGELAGAHIWLTDQEGNVLAGQVPDRWSRKFYAENIEQMNLLFNGEPQSWIYKSRRHTDPSVIVALPVTTVPIPVAIFLSDPIVGINQTTDALENLLIYSLMLGFLTAAILGLITSRNLTRPIASISRAAADFAKGNFLSRTTVTANDELGQLGRTFNNMADSLAYVEQNRRDFLANVSHELKTPVASIQALAEAIQDGLATKPGQQDRYLSTIVGETHRIGRLISDLLDLAQLEAGELSIQEEKVNLKDLLMLEYDKHTALLAEKKLTINFAVPDNMPLILADTDRLTQVLDNLLTNAIRHSLPESAIGIEVDNTMPFTVAVSISNQGAGIASEDLPYIWDRFYRADKSRTRAAGGAGLGLAITRKLVQAMNGDITVKSIPDKRTTFTFTLPVIPE